MAPCECFSSTILMRYTTILAVNFRIHFFTILRILSPSLGRSFACYNLHSFLRATPTRPLSLSDIPGCMFFPFLFLLFIVFVYEINLFFINKPNNERSQTIHTNFKAIQFGMCIVCYTYISGQLTMCPFSTLLSNVHRKYVDRRRAIQLARQSISATHSHHRRR